MLLKNKVKVILFLTIIVSLYSMYIYFSNNFSHYISSTAVANMKISNSDTIKLYYSENNSFTEDKSISLPAEYDNKELSHHISIQNASEKNPNSKATEIWVISIKADDKEVSLSNLQLKGQWELKPFGDHEALVSYDQTELSTASIDLLYKNKLDITFLKHNYSGFANVGIDDENQMLDLYNPTSVLFNKDFKQKLPINHNYIFQLPDENIHFVKFVPNHVISNVELSTNNMKYKVEASNDYYKIIDDKFNHRPYLNILSNIVLRVITSALISILIFHVITLLKQMKLSRYGFLFYILILLGICVRFIFLLDFPYGFFFNDSGGYLQTSMALTKDATFITNLERTPGYGVFIYLVNVYFPYKSIYLIIIQNSIGVYMSILVFNLIRRFVNNFFAYVGMILILFSPHFIIYEHTVLTDILFSFILMLYVKNLIIRVSINEIKVIDTFRWGIFVALLIMIRPAGYYLIPISLIILVIISRINKDLNKMILKKVFMYISPIIFVVLLWNSWNFYKFDYFGTTAINGLGLSLTAGNLVDFTSTKYEKYKEVIKDPVKKVNTEYNGELIGYAKFMAYDSNGVLNNLANIMPELNQGERDNIYYAIFKEGILAHPLTYGFHFFHELKKIYLHDMSVNYYTDLRGSYINFDTQSNEVLLIDKKSIVENSEVRVSDNYLGYQSFNDKIIFNHLIPFLPSTFKFYFFTMIAILGGLYIPFANNSLKNKLIISIFIIINISHTIFNSLTNYAVDRYMIPVLPFLIIFGLVGIGYLYQDIRDIKLPNIKVRLLIYLGVLSTLIIVAGVYYKFIFNHIKFGIYIDKPILGLSDDWFKFHQDYTIHCIILLLILSIIFISSLRVYQKLMSNMKKTVDNI